MFSVILEILKKWIFFSSQLIQYLILFASLSVGLTFPVLTKEWNLEMMQCLFWVKSLECTFSMDLQETPQRIGIQGICQIGTIPTSSLPLISYSDQFQFLLPFELKNFCSEFRNKDLKNFWYFGSSRSDLKARNFLPLPYLSSLSSPFWVFCARKLFSQQPGWEPSKLWI